MEILNEGNMNEQVLSYGNKGPLGSSSEEQGLVWTSRS